MDTHKLTADYICKDDERLQMALYVYEAMPAIRKYLIKNIFEAAGKRVRDAIKIDDDQLQCQEEAVYFWTGQTGDFWIYAELEHRKRGPIQLVAGLYADDEKPFEAHREVTDRLKTGRLAEWPIRRAKNRVRCDVWHYGRWDADHFLQRAIRNRDEVVSDLEEILLQIHRGVFESPAQEP